MPSKERDAARGSHEKQLRVNANRRTQSAKLARRTSASAPRCCSGSEPGSPALARSLALKSSIVSSAIFLAIFCMVDEGSMECEKGGKGKDAHRYEIPCGMISSDQGLVCGSSPISGLYRMHLNPSPYPRDEGQDSMSTPRLSHRLKEEDSTEMDAPRARLDTCSTLSRAIRHQVMRGDGAKCQQGRLQPIPRNSRRRVICSTHEMTCIFSAWVVTSTYHGGLGHAIFVKDDTLPGDEKLNLSRAPRR